MDVPELERFRLKVQRMRAVATFPCDPRFNALYWISDCWFLSYQIEYSVREMEQRVREYRQDIRPGERPSDSDQRLSYFADNAIVRLFALREKLGLCLLSYFFIVDPRNQVSGFSEILEQLSLESSQKLRGAAQACRILTQIQRPPSVLKQYRDAKIHRREPRIEIYGVESHHDAPYYVPESCLSVTDSLATVSAFRPLTANENPRLFAYQHVNKAFKDFKRKCYRAADESATFLKRRVPFRD